LGIARADPVTSKKSVLSHAVPFEGEMIAKNTAGFPSSGVGSAVGGETVGTPGGSISGVGVAVEHAANPSIINVTATSRSFFMIYFLQVALILKVNIITRIHELTFLE
jgi:hypothetical protein